MRFGEPWALALLVLVPLYLWWRWPYGRHAAPPSLALPTVALLGGAPRSVRERILWVPAVLRALVLALLIVALARPRVPDEVHDITTRGRNIMIALDISSSMKALDFRPADRIGAAKQVLARFITARRGDFMGLVLFASRPFTQAPLTDDDAVLQELLARADIGLLPDGTAIGSALAMAENHLKNLPRKSGVIILLTDGGNNTGAPDPITAARIAQAIGVRIYVIGVSARSNVRVPDDAWVRGLGQQYTSRRELAYGEEPAALSAREEQLLQQIAAVSGGRYYRATDERALAGIFGGIDRLETTTLHEREVLRWHEYAAWLVAPALLLLVAEITLCATWLRTVP